MKKLNTQLHKLARHFRIKGTCTPFEAANLYDVLSFHRRIRDLVERGWKFSTYRKKDLTGRHYVEYMMTECPPHGALGEKAR